MPIPLAIPPQTSSSFYSVVCVHAMGASCSNSVISLKALLMTSSIFFTSPYCPSGLEPSRYVVTFTAAARFTAFLSQKVFFQQG